VPCRVAYVEIDSIQKSALFNYKRRDFSKQLRKIIHLFHDLVDLRLSLNYFLVGHRKFLFYLERFLRFMLVLVQLRRFKLFISLNAINPLKAIKLILFYLPESSCYFLQTSVVVLLHIRVDLLIKSVFVVVSLFFHLYFGLFKLFLELFYPRVKTSLTTLNLQV